MMQPIKQLDDVSLAMLYACGELHGEERVAFERRMDSDAALRGEVERLQAATADAMDGVSRLDRYDVAGVTELSAVRSAQRVIRKRLIEGTAVPASKGDRDRTMRAWWAMPLAAAASVALAAMVWQWQSPATSVPPAPDAVAAAPDSPTLAANPAPDPAPESSVLAMMVSKSLAVSPENSAEEALDTGERLLADAQSVAGEAFWERDWIQAY